MVTNEKEFTLGAVPSVPLISILESIPITQALRPSDSLQQMPTGHDADLDETVPPGFVDIRIAGLDEGQTTRADLHGSLYDVHFVLSVEPPSGWGRIIQTYLEPKGILGRRAWPIKSQIIIRCVIDEVEQLYLALKPLVESANLEYRAWYADQIRKRNTIAAFDHQEREKLRLLKLRLTFD
jgi:hypothetical protein